MVAGIFGTTPPGRRTQWSGRFRAMLQMLLAVALVPLVGCTTPDSTEFVPVAMDLGQRDRSWSWSMLESVDGESVVIAGLDQRGGSAATLQIVRFQESWLERMEDVPQPPGEPHSAHLLSVGDTLAVVGTQILDNLEPRVFLLTSPDGREWQQVQIEDIRGTAAVVISDGADIYLGGPAGLWKLGLNGAVSPLAQPAPRYAALIDLVAHGDTLSALLRSADGDELMVSEDGGESWQSPQRLASEDAESMRLERLQLLDGDLAATGSCKRTGERDTRPCLLTSLGGQQNIEWPPMVGPGSLMLPVFQSNEEEYGIVTATRFSEGYLVKRQPGGQWESSGPDLVGPSPGQVVAATAYPGWQEGTVAIVATTSQTELVSLTGHVDLRLPLGGSNGEPYIHASGRSVAAGSGWVTRTRRILPIHDAGGYAVVQDESPVSLIDGSLTHAEWRPATSRGLSFTLTASDGATTVLAASTPVTSREESGEVKVFHRDEEGTWRRVAQELHEEFSNSMVTSMHHDGEKWLLAVSTSVSEEATSASAIYTSEDGVHWESLNSPASTTLRVERFCSDGDQLLVLGTTSEQDPEVWQQKQSQWDKLELADDIELSDCAHHEAALLLFGTRDADAVSEGVVWRLTALGLEETESLGLPPTARIESALSRDGRLAVAGHVDVLGVKQPMVWLSSDAGDWHGYPLGTGSPRTTAIRVASGPEGFLVLTSDERGSRLWKEVPTS